MFTKPKHNPWEIFTCSGTCMHKEVVSTQRTIVASLYMLQSSSALDVFARPHSEESQHDVMPWSLVQKCHRAQSDKLLQPGLVRIISSFPIINNTRRPSKDTCSEKWDQILRINIDSWLFQVTPLITRNASFIMNIWMYTHSVTKECVGGGRFHFVMYSTLHKTAVGGLRPPQLYPSTSCYFAKQFWMIHWLHWQHVWATSIYMLMWK